MENIIRNSKLGFDVSSYYKSSTDILQSVTTEKIRDEINNGVSLINFLAILLLEHGSFHLKIQEIIVILENIHL
ncbi:MAG: hypothetical protein IPG48_18690 [Saprospiraceae bacterium]|nr:hypothetical protein [Saprospiraceae bacterium]